VHKKNNKNLWVYIETLNKTIYTKIKLDFFYWISVDRRGGWSKRDSTWFNYHCKSFSLFSKQLFTSRNSLKTMKSFIVYRTSANLMKGIYFFGTKLNTEKLFPTLEALWKSKTQVERLFGVFNFRPRQRSKHPFLKILHFPKLSKATRIEDDWEIYVDLHE
jgi:hypothetical protein